jgi:hypothetical protein
MKLIETATPEVWNDSVWIFLYCLADNFPRYPNQKLCHLLKNFFTSLPNVLPCANIRSCYLEFFKHYPFSKSLLKESPLPLLQYVIDLRNYVMKSYERPFRTVTKRDVEILISKKCLKSTVNSSKSPTVWGSSTWLFLHCISFSFPNNPSKKDKKIYKIFLESLSQLLPCNVCKLHMQNYLILHPVENSMKSRESFIKYIINMHNHVNVKYNNKKKISMKEAKNLVRLNCLEKLIQS